MKYIQTILTIAAIGLFTACSKDSVENQSEPLTDASIKMLRATRTDPVGDDTYGDIRVFLHENTNVMEGVFKYAGGSSWTAQIKLRSGEHSFRLYGIMPDDATVTKSLVSYGNTGGSIQLENLVPVSENDYCVVTGVRQVASETDLTPAVRGTFSFNYISNSENYINLLFDHVYARLVFRMNVAADYDALRTIKVRRMRMEVSGASQFRAQVALANSVGISSVTFIPTGTGLCSNTFMEGETTLTTAVTDVASVQVIPYSTVLSGLTLITEYDVYDKQGNKIAERTATNKLVEPLAELQRAEERTLLITVDPSYLYVLSEQDPPAVVIRKL